MDSHQLKIESNGDGLVHLKQFMHCPVLFAFIERKEIDDSQHSKPLGDYLKARLKYLLESYYEASQSSNTRFDEWEVIVKYAIDKVAPGVNSETWSRYKAALTKTLNVGLDKELAPLELIRSWLSQVKTSKAPDKRTLKSTSQRNHKASKITPAELYILRLHAKTSNEVFAVDWLELAVCTGIRPVEIKSSELHYVDDGNFLSCENVIKNDKTLQKIASGEIDPKRTISLAHVSYHSLKLIEATLIEYHYRKKQESDHLPVYRTSRNALSDLSLRALGYRVSLSVGRKQFAANKKALGESPDVLASEMGHTDVTRARRSYGRTNNGFAKKAEFKESEIGNEQD